MALPLVGDSGGFRNAFAKRQSQLVRWEESETNKEPVILRPHLGKVRFPEDCVFLAACAQFDKKEIDRLLDKGANINTGNIDGLTALHQACIDGKLDMVQFMAERGADLDVCDNEGWTPLHATASCGFLDIAKYLLENGANISSVNNDGELSVDIAEDDPMREFLHREMELRGLDADSARREEEEIMLNDANNWLQNKVIRETNHPKTGATALHVAAAKGYIKVLTILLQMDNVDIDVKDGDSWTPLHAAAHWGQEESCRILAENLCNMELKNKWGQTAFDVAAPELVELLKEMKEKQATLRKDRQENQQQIINRVQLPVKRRSSVTRLSNDQKQNLVLKNVEEERAQLEAIRAQDKESEEISTSTTSSEESESDTSDLHNEINNRSTVQTITQANDDKQINIAEPTSNALQARKKLSQGDATTPQIQDPVIKELDRPMDVKDRVTERLKERQKERQREREKAKEREREKAQEPAEKKLDTKPSEDKDKPKSEKGNLRVRDPPSIRINTTATRLLNRQVSAPVPPVFSLNSPTGHTGPAMWRLGLRKTTSTQQVSSICEDDTTERPPLFRSYSSPFLAESEERLSSQPENNETANRERRRFIAPNAFVASTSSSSSTTSVPAASRFQQSSYIPYHVRRKQQDETTTATTTSTVTTTTATSSNRGSKFEPPKRDEEAESQRRSRAKRARETRRSTQGVTKEDVERAEQALAASDKDDTRRTRTAPTITDKEENKSDKENKPEEIPSYRKSWEERKEERLRASQTLNKENSDGPPTLRISRSTGSNDSSTVSQRSSFRDRPGSKEEKPEEIDKSRLDPEQDPRISQAFQARRKRKERRSTGKVNPEDLPSSENEKEKENQNEKKESEDKCSERGSKYGLTADYSRDRERPSSPYSGSSTSSSVLPDREKDSSHFKKLYEDEKVECERLRNDIRRLQQENVENKSKADELKKEKRALERKLSKKKKVPTATLR